MINAILLDIEGTTTPIDFVHQTLFPFSRHRIAGFVEQNWLELSDEIAELEAEYSDERSRESGLDISSPASVTRYLEFLIDNDRKSTPLKSIQGKIWQSGYEGGKLRSEVFSDVPTAFERWHREGKRIAIYSSGSTLAQRLIFKHSDQGDLTPFISHYFDTNTGPKREPHSYTKIATSLGCPPLEIFFVSDIVPELDAAATSGMRTALSVRPGNAAIGEVHSHKTVKTFDQLPV